MDNAKKIWGIYRIAYNNHVDIETPNFQKLEFVTCTLYCLKYFL